MTPSAVCSACSTRTPSDAPSRRSRRSRGRRRRRAGDRRQDPAAVVRPGCRALGPAPRHRLRRGRAGGDRAEPAVAAGENETLTARALLETLALDGLLVTGDAMHAQAETAALVLAQGGDYLFALKANRPAMLGEVEAFFADPPQSLPVFETTDADHGRIEIRRHRVSHDVRWLFSERRYAGEPRLPGLAAIASVEAERILERQDHPQPPDTISAPPRSLRSASPRPCAATGRSRTPCTGCSTSPSTRTAPATAAPTGPQNLAILRTPHPQPPAQGPPKHVGQSKTQTRRMVRPLRKNHHRPNAIALFIRP